MTPTALNKTATKIFETLTDGLTTPGDHKNFDAHGYTEKWNGGIMAAHIEHIGHLADNPLWSIAHYYKQNGDMMRDPDMVFMKSPHGKIYPISFEMSAMGKYEESIFIDHETGGVKLIPKLQRQHTTFANTWMKNIKEQQNL